MKEFLDKMFESEIYGIFFPLILFLSGCLIIRHYRRLSRVMKGEIKPNKKDLKRIFDMSESIYHHNNLEDTYNMMKNYGNDDWWEEDKKRRLEESKYPDAMIRLRMFSGVVLIVVSIVIFIMGLKL